VDPVAEAEALVADYVGQAEGVGPQVERIWAPEMIEAGDAVPERGLGTGERRAA